LTKESNGELVQLKRNATRLKAGYSCLFSLAVAQLPWRLTAILFYRSTLNGWFY